jgi:putative oxidoreductase
MTNSSSVSPAQRRIGLLPSGGFLGGLLLTSTMVGAVATHLVLIGGNPAPALVLGLLSAFVAWRQRPAPRVAAAG